MRLRFIVSLIVALLFTGGVNGATREKYYTSPTGVDLYWEVYIPPPPATGTHPAVLLLHAGGFRSGKLSQLQTAGVDLARAGYVAFATEYRLAPNAGPMNAPPDGTHEAPGQNTVSDNGQYPKALDDIGQAILKARTDPRCNGQVIIVGGSAGGFLGSWWAFTGTPGTTREDVLVCLSGAYDLSDPGSLADNTRANFKEDAENWTWTGITPPAEPVYSNTLYNNSPISKIVGPGIPIFLIAADQDTMPLQQFPLMWNALERVGYTASTAGGFGTYNKLLRVPNKTEHAFAAWSGVGDVPEVKTLVIDYINSALQPTPTPDPNVRNAASAARNDVNYAINGGGPDSNGVTFTGAIPEGGTVNIPTGTAIWTTDGTLTGPANPITITTPKNFQVIGSGWDSTILQGTVFFVWTQTTSVNTARIKGIQFRQTFGVGGGAHATGDFRGGVGINGTNTISFSGTGAPQGGFVIENIKWTNDNVGNPSQDGYIFVINGWIEGVMSHCLLDYPPPPVGQALHNEIIDLKHGAAPAANPPAAPTATPITVNGHTGTNNFGHYSWATAYDWGNTVHAFYVENCIFRAPMGGRGDRFVRRSDWWWG